MFPFNNTTNHYHNLNNNNNAYANVQNQQQHNYNWEISSRPTTPIVQNVEQQHYANTNLRPNTPAYI